MHLSTSSSMSISGFSPDVEALLSMARFSLQLLTIVNMALLMPQKSEFDLLFKFSKESWPCLHSGICCAKQSNSWWKASILCLNQFKNFLKVFLDISYPHVKFLWFRNIFEIDHCLVPFHNFFSSIGTWFFSHLIVNGSVLRTRIVPMCTTSIINLW